jgi:hypothetical protein
VYSDKSRALILLFILSFGFLKYSVSLYIGSNGSEKSNRAKSSAERRTLRSKTFNGIAKAMAKQWTECVIDSQTKLF